MSLGKNINGAIDSQQKVQQILGDDQVEFGITDLHIGQPSKLPEDPLNVSTPHPDPNSIELDEFDDLFGDSAEFELALANAFWNDDPFINSPPNKEHSIIDDKLVDINLIDSKFSTPIDDTANIDLPEIAAEDPKGTHPPPIIEISSDTGRSKSPSEVSLSPPSEVSLSPPSTSAIPLYVSSSTDAMPLNSSSISIEKEKLPTRRHTRRQLSDIQLKPYTLEGARYRQLIGQAPSSYKLSNTQSTHFNDDCDDDLDFTLTQTQRVDEHLEEVFSNRLTSNFKRKKQPPADENDSLDLESLSTSLNKLISSPVERAKETRQNKPITFQKKGRRKTQPKLILPTRRKKNLNEDIFNFDQYIRTKNQTTTTSPIVIEDTTTSNSPTSRTDYDPDVMDIDNVYDNEDRVHNYKDNMHSDEVIPNYGIDGNDEDDDDSDDDMPVFKRPPLHKRRIFSSDSEDESEQEGTQNNEEMNQEEMDAIFDFPALLPRRHLRSAEESVVPIVNDESEHPEVKRTRMGIQDLKAHTLKNVLPASFYKLNEKKFHEEIRQRKLLQQQKKSQPTASDATYSYGHLQRDKEDIYAAFRSENEESDNEDICNTPDTTDVSFIEHPPYVASRKGKEKIPQDQHNFSNKMTKSHPSLAASEGKGTTLLGWQDFMNPSATSRSSETINTAHISSGSSAERQLPHKVSNSDLSASECLSEAIEDNSIYRQQNYGERNKTTSARPKGLSRGVSRPATKRTLQSNTEATGKQAPPRKKRKPKRLPSNIYIREPYFKSGSDQKQKQKFYKSINADPASVFQGNVKQRAFDDICVNTNPPELRLKSGLIHIHKSGDGLIDKHVQKNDPRHRIRAQTLETVAKTVYELVDVNLRRISGLQKTVYLHHKLLTPLLSPALDRKSAYARFKESYSELVIFEKRYYWREFDPVQGRVELFESLLMKVFQDMADMRFNFGYNTESILPNELVGHDYFYVFVSLFISQWITNYDYEDQRHLIDLLAHQIGGLARMISKLSEAKEHENISWKPIIKLMLFILDWTCRLHNLGMNAKIWSVTECTAIIIDILVFIGIAPIEHNNEEYIIEAWTCLFQIMSVSIRGSGYAFKAEVFIDQMTDSIKRNSRKSNHPEVKRLRATWKWSEVLTNILEKHMMQ